jgi:hypothetical protein
MKQALKVKLEMAKFLQQTLDDMAVQGKGRSSEAAKEFAEFFIKVRCHFSFPHFGTLSSIHGDLVNLWGGNRPTFDMRHHHQHLLQFLEILYCDKFSRNMQPLMG